MTVDDSEVASVAGKRLVVGGGSAINSVVAELLGAAYSEAAFTSPTEATLTVICLNPKDKTLPYLIIK